MKFHRRLLLVTVSIIVTVLAMMNLLFAEVLLAVYCAIAVCFILIHKWEITYVKGRKPPIEIIATRRR